MRRIAKNSTWVISGSLRVSRGCLDVLGKSLTTALKLEGWDYLSRGHYRTASAEKGLRLSIYLSRSQQKSEGTLRVYPKRI